MVTIARALSGSGRFEEAVDVALEAVALTESLGLDELHARSLSTLGFCRAELDEDEGLANLEQSLDLALALGSPVAIGIYNNLAHQLRHRGDFVRSIELFEEGLRLAGRMGDAPTGRFLRSMLPHMRYRQGRWDEALELADAFLGEVQAEHLNVWHALGTRALIRLSRGDEAGLEDASASIEAARKSVDPSNLPATLEVYAHALILAGRREEAAAALEEALSLLETGLSQAGFDLPLLAFVTLEVGENRDRILAVARPRTRWLDAARCYFEGDFGGAADVYGEIGSRPHEAEARLRAARSHLDAGRRAEGEAQLEQALAFFRGVGATRFVREGEALLSATDSHAEPARARSPRRAP